VGRCPDINIYSFQVTTSILREFNGFVKDNNKLLEQLC
jgi:hypothetical protein